MKLVQGRIEKPPRILLYGIEGVGKSTFAAAAPAPIFLCSEDGTSQLNIDRFPEPCSWTSVTECVGQLLEEEHEYETFIIDTLDWLEPILWNHIAEAAKKPSIGDIAHGRGYMAAIDEWRALMHSLDQLRDDRNMTITVIAHSHIRAFRNPEGEDFDRYELKLNSKAAGLWKQWSDAVLFTQYETYVNETEDERQLGKGVSSGKRMIRTQWHAAYDAKNRYDMPPDLPLEWPVVESYLLRQDTTELLQRIEVLSVNLDEPTRKKAADLVKRAQGDVSKLRQIINWMEKQE